MHFIVPLLIIGLCSFPMWSEAGASKPTNAPSKKQTIVSEQNKKLNHKQQRELTKSVKQGKCKKGLDKKTKQVVYICSKQ